jgi:hypothetical protein
LTIWFGIRLRPDPTLEDDPSRLRGREVPRRLDLVTYDGGDLKLRGELDVPPGAGVPTAHPTSVTGIAVLPAGRGSSPCPAQLFRHATVARGELGYLALNRTE